MNFAASVIIPVHNAGATLDDQLAALAGQANAPAFEVIVVLNRCTDESANIASKYRPALHLTVIEVDALASAAYARNCGASVSSAPLLLFCDADDRVGPGWVNAMVRALQSTPADFVGGKLLVDRDGLPDWIYRWRYQRQDYSCITSSYSGLPFAVSASLGCTRLAFESVSGFDERFSGTGGEEVDLAHRLLRSGWRIGTAEEATVCYRPRTTMHGAQVQLHSYREGNAILRAKEGDLLSPPSVTQALSSVARLGAHMVIRERELHPKAIYCRLVDAFHRIHIERRGTWDAMSSDDNRATAVKDFVAPLTTPLIGGMAFQSGQARWYATLGVEQWSLALLEGLLPLGGRFVDCGANVGTFTLAAALRAGASGLVIALEPDPRSRKLLEENLRRHGQAQNVEVLSVAAGSLHTQLPFRLYENDVVSGLGSAALCNNPGKMEGEVMVDVVPLTDVVKAPIDMLKIDVEGFERSVLDGAVDLLARSPEVTLLVELNPIALRCAGYDVEDVLEFFPPSRWALWLIDDHALRPADAIRELTSEMRAFVETADPTWYGNLLAVPRHRRREVEALVKRWTTRTTA